jgi:hypothetical protein
MILPPLGSWLFISLVAYLVQSTEAVTLMLITDRNFSIGRSSIGVSGREIPAFCKDDVGCSVWDGQPMGWSWTDVEEHVHPAYERRDSDMDRGLSIDVYRYDATPY